MNINILRYSLFGIAGGQQVDRNFSYDNKCLLFVPKLQRHTDKFVELQLHFTPNQKNCSLTREFRIQTYRQ